MYVNYYQQLVNCRSEENQSVVDTAEGSKENSNSEKIEILCREQVGACFNVDGYIAPSALLRTKS